MADDIDIRPATVDDVSSVMTLDRECPTAAHWTERQYQDLFAAPAGGIESLILIAGARAEPTLTPHFAQRAREIMHPRILGFLVARRVHSEWALENIVVASSARRKGLGKRLLECLLARAAATSGAVFLEVRESNAAARKLYEKAGFEVCGRRKSYYQSPSEDAVLYGQGPQ